MFSLKNLERKGLTGSHPQNTDGLAHDFNNSNALPIELLQSCTKPSTRWETVKLRDAFYLLYQGRSTAAESEAKSPFKSILLMSRDKGDKVWIERGNSVFTIHNLQSSYNFRRE